MCRNVRFPKVLEFLDFYALNYFEETDDVRIPINPKMKPTEINVNVIAIITGMILLIWLQAYFVFIKSISISWIIPVDLLLAIITYVSLKVEIDRPQKETAHWISALRKGRLSEDWSFSKSINKEVKEALLGLRIRIIDMTSCHRDVILGDFETPFIRYDAQDELGHSLNMLQNHVFDTIERIIEVGQTASETGKLEVQLAHSNQEGAWKELISSVNKLVASFSEPMVILNRIINAMSRSDMTHRYDTVAKGEFFDLAQNFNAALDNLESFLLEVYQSAEVIGEYTEEMKVSGEEMSVNTSEIASSISQISHGASLQVSKVDEVLSLVEQLQTGFGQVLTSVEKINQSSKNGTLNSAKGIEVIDDINANVEDIVHASNETNHSMQELSSKADQISDVLDVINQVSSQTNLLALNAAIEAAQAGEAGRGFSVVAEEIRKLATDSQNSAKRIEGIVRDLQDHAETAAMMMSQMDKNLQYVGEKTSSTTTSFEAIHQSSTEIEKHVKEIVTAIKDQMHQVKHVSKNTENIVVVAEQSAAGSEQVATSASELASGTENYLQKVLQFSEIAKRFKEGIEVLKLSKKSDNNSSLFDIKKAYEKEKMFLDALLNYLPDYIYFKDEESKFVRVSRSMLELHQLPSMSQILGKSDFDFFGEHARNAFEDEQQIIERNQPIVNQIETEDRSDGGVTYVSTTKLPLRDLEGHVIGTFGISRDVSERIEVEQQLKECRERMSSLSASENLNYMPD